MFDIQPDGMIEDDHDEYWLEPEEPIDAIENSMFDIPVEQEVNYNGGGGGDLRIPMIWAPAHGKGPPVPPKGPETFIHRGVKATIHPGGNRIDIAPASGGSVSSDKPATQEEIWRFMWPKHESIDKDAPWWKQLSYWLYCCIHNIMRFLFEHKEFRTFAEDVEARRVANKLKEWLGDDVILERKKKGGGPPDPSEPDPMDGPDWW